MTSSMEWVLKRPPEAGKQTLLQDARSKRIELAGIK